jgi:hypothetical protein
VTRDADETEAAGRRRLEAAMTTPENDDLRERAREHVEHLPAETALGNADPAGGVDEDPKAYDEEHQGQP